MSNTSYGIPNTLLPSTTTKLVPELKDLPCEERLRKMDLPSWHYRRARGDMIETFKYLHQKYTVNTDLLEREERGNTRGHSFKLKKKFCKSTPRSHFFSFRVTNLWNSLPEEVVTSPSLNCLKSRLDKHWSEYRYVCHSPKVTPL